MTYTPYTSNGTFVSKHNISNTPPPNLYPTTSPNYLLQHSVFPSIYNSNETLYFPTEMEKFRDNQPK